MLLLLLLLLLFTALQALASPAGHHDEDDCSGLTDSDTDDETGTHAGGLAGWVGKSPARP